MLDKKTKRIQELSLEVMILKEQNKKQEHKIRANRFEELKKKAWDICITDMNMDTAELAEYLDTEEAAELFELSEDKEVFGG